MSIRDSIKDALEFDYYCAGCGVRLREGDGFVIAGTVTPAILHGAIANTKQQVELLGGLRCSSCAPKAMGAA